MMLVWMVMYFKVKMELMDVPLNGLGRQGCPGRPARGSWASTCHYISNIRAGVQYVLKRRGTMIPVLLMRARRNCRVLLPLDWTTAS